MRERVTKIERLGRRHLGGRHVQDSSFPKMSAQSVFLGVEEAVLRAQAVHSPLESLSKGPAVVLNRLAGALKCLGLAAPGESPGNSYISAKFTAQLVKGWGALSLFLQSTSVLSSSLVDILPGCLWSENSVLVPHITVLRIKPRPPWHAGIPPSYIPGCYIFR